MIRHLSRSPTASSMRRYSSGLRPRPARVRVGYVGRDWLWRLQAILVPASRESYAARDAAANRLARRTLVLLLIAAPVVAMATAAVELTSRQQMQSSKSSLVSSAGNVRAQSFAGTWQGVWHDTWMGSQSSLSVTLSVKAGDGKLSGVTSSTLQNQPVQKRAAPSLEA